MSLNHLLKDLNKFGIYSDVYISLGGTDPNNELKATDGTVSVKYPFYGKCNLNVRLRENGYMLKTKFRKYKLLIDNQQKFVVILAVDDNIFTSVKDNSIPFNDMLVLSMFVIFHKYRIRSSGDLERYVNRWIEKQ